MRNNYGSAAVIAVEKIINGECEHPREAWDLALLKFYDKESSSYRKGCPKNAFLGLCEEGKIDGIAVGVYTKSLKNKAYSLKACELILKNNLLVNDVKRLWDLVVGPNGPAHNSQLNVVIDLYKNGLIKT